MHRDLERLTSRPTPWWLNPATIRDVIRARQSLAVGWDTSNLVSALGLILDNPLAPIKCAHYRAVFRTVLEAPVRPRFTTLLCPPALSQPHVALEQLRSKHLRPSHNLTLPLILAITGWLTTPLTVLPPDVETLHRIIAASPNSAPAHDGISFATLKLLEPRHLLPLVRVITLGLEGEPLPHVSEGTFFAIPKKNRGPFIADSRPIVNMTTLTKVITSWVRDLLRPHCLTHGYVTHHQFAAFPRCSTHDLIRVLHDTAL